MRKERELSLLSKTGVAVAFVALAFLGTLFIRVPLPAGGYFNLGDAFVMMAAVFFGPVTGFLAGLLGPAAADLVGYPPFVPATMIVKSLEGLLVGLIAHRPERLSAKVAGVGVGAVVIVAGYFFFEAYAYPYLGESMEFFQVTDFNAAVLEIIPNILQGGISGAVTVTVWKFVKGRDAEG